MRKFKLVYWNDVRWNTEIEGVLVEEFGNNKEVFEGVIESKLYDEDWIESVNCVVNEEGEWVNNREDWEGLFICGNGSYLDKKEFSIDFCDEFSSCLVIREDSEYFDLDFEGKDGIDLLYKVEESII
jgi:hypothetical protein